MAVDREKTEPRPAWTGDRGHEMGMEAGMKIKIKTHVVMEARMDLQSLSPPPRRHPHPH